MIENKFRLKGFVVWFICALFFMYEFLLRTVVGTYQQQLMHDLHLTNIQFSFISTTIFLIIYGVMQIPVGLLVDNYGLKKTLLFASLICGIAAIGFSYSHTFYMGLLYRMLMGLGASFGFICLLISVTDWMPHSYTAILIGFSQFLGTMGPMFAAGPLTTLSNDANITWRVIFFGLGIIGLSIFLLVLFFVENNQHSTGKYLILNKPEKISASLKKLFSRGQPWIIALTCTCIYFSVEYLSENEGRIFLQLKGLSMQAASNMLSISWIGFALGCPLVGFLSDYFERRKFILNICSLLTLCATLTIVYSTHKDLVLPSFFVLGLGASGISIGYALISEQFKECYVAVGFGLANAIIMTISALNAPLIGYILDFISKGSKLTLQMYTDVFSILVFISIVGVFTSIVLTKETFCKSTVDFTILKNKN